MDVQCHPIVSLLYVAFFGWRVGLLWKATGLFSPQPSCLSGSCAFVCVMCTCFSFFMLALVDHFSQKSEGPPFWELNLYCFCDFFPSLFSLFFLELSFFRFYVLIWPSDFLFQFFGFLFGFLGKMFPSLCLLVLPLKCSCFLNEVFLTSLGISYFVLFCFAFSLFCCLHFLFILVSLMFEAFLEDLLLSLYT